MLEKIKVAIIGPGNIGLDLLYKIERSPYLELAYMIGIQDSLGIETAKGKGVKTTTEGIDGFLPESDDVSIVFDCTSAKAHLYNGPKLKEKGIFTIDLTPAAIGPMLIPAVNLTDQMLELDNVNMVTCAGQATTPIVAAINAVADVSYAEVVSSISSKSAGPGTRANIDEFTVTTQKALKEVGGADESKVIIVLNPAEPPIYMRNTIYTRVKHTDLEIIKKAVEEMVLKIKAYVPGYKLMLEPIIQDDVVTTIIQVAGLGDYLPVYSGNLDIITSAAVNIAEKYAQRRAGDGKDV
uniref:acetaldehyde dehydrogenase (acetylating) n=1 Tax=Fusibacter ferrireducens TaxID=2785058 RepID=UPI0038990566